MVLDPATGKPMPGSPAFKDERFHGVTCRSGSVCPESGYWKIDSYNYHFYTVKKYPDDRYVKKGETMPYVEGAHYRARIWPLSATLVPTEVGLRWQLLG